MTFVMGGISRGGSRQVWVAMPGCAKAYEDL